MQLGFYWHAEVNIVCGLGAQNEFETIAELLLSKDSDNSKEVRLVPEFALVSIPNNAFLFM